MDTSHGGALLLGMTPGSIPLAINKEIIHKISAYLTLVSILNISIILLVCLKMDTQELQL